MKQDLGLLVDNYYSTNMDGDAEEYCTVRQFSISGRKVVNRGDSFKVKRSTSGHSVTSITSCQSSGRDADPRLSKSPSLSPGLSVDCGLPFSVVLLGATATGKTSLISQFMTSDFLHAYDTSIGDCYDDKTVAVLLDGEESELSFTDLPYSILQREDILDSSHAVCVVYSITDRCSFLQAEMYLQELFSSALVDHRAIILVANKVDLVRSRVVSEQEGMTLATSYNCKFIETSVAINHNVDELLVGILAQIRLKVEGRTDSKRSRKYRGSKTSSSLRGLFNKLKLSKSKSCHKLHVL